MTINAENEVGNEAEAAEIVLRPVGVVKNRIKEPMLKSDEQGIRLQGDMKEAHERVRAVRQGRSEIVIRPELAGVLDGLEDYSHAVVVYWAHKAPPKSREVQHVHPMGRKDMPLMGVYATCSPARPNPVLTTVVRLNQREDNVLTVIGLDAVNGSPVLDIKPYVKEMYPQKDVRIAGWMQSILDEMGEREL